MKKVASLFVRGVLSIVVFILVGYSQETLGADKIQISIGSGTPGAVMYPLGAGISNIINRENPGYNAIVEQTGGARENISLLVNKKIEMGLTVDNFALEKYDGQSYLYGWFCYNTDVEIVVWKGSQIDQMKDLKGKKVSLGPPGSAANVVMSKVISGYGIGEKDFGAQFLEWDKASDAMMDGLLDATTFMGIWPVSSLQSLAMRKPIKVLSIDPVIIKKQLGKGYRPFVIPADAYTDKSVSVVAINGSIWLRGDLKEELVYNIVKSIFANIDYLSQFHRAFKQFRISSRKEVEELGVKVHPGVLKYAKEKGLW